MRVKLDENLPTHFASLLRSGGHDVTTVHDENLAGAKDSILASVVSQERRLLLTHDLDFADVRKYPLGSHGGIIVFRLKDQRWKAMETPARRLLESGRLGGGLAVVDETRIRTRFAGKR